MGLVRWSQAWRLAIYPRRSCPPAVLSSRLVSVSPSFQRRARQLTLLVVGCAIAAYLNNLLGRRLALMITAFISIIGVVIEITSAVGASARFNQFVVGKTIASIAMGLCVNIVPVYLSETSPASARGLGISLYQNIQASCAFSNCGLIIGVLIASGVVFATSTMNTQSSYLIPMGIQLVAPGLMLLATPFLPESPRWLVLNGRQAEAEVSATKLLGSEAANATEYCEKIRAAYEQEQIVAKASSWADLTRGADLRRLLIAVGIQSLQQAQGSSYMNSYIVSFLVGTGVKDVFPVIMGLYCLYYVAIIAGGFLADISGRRSLMICTAGFCGACLLIVAILTTAYATPTSAVSNASIALIFLWYASFGLQSPIIWTITTESCPTVNREKVLAVATFMGFGVSLLISSVSPYLQDPGYGNLGSKIGFIWGSFSIITVIWTWFFVPEMKGFSLEQLDHLFIERTPTRAFKRYVFEDEIEPVGEHKMDMEDGKKDGADVDVVPAMRKE
ncbi:general substrate transporter [Dioszegia hungarica]|uniref:General substrate transporter n=1 Tax=Dioszegia hungarica TaxID=4972 RepID=A0AA38HEK2_9TREE|nr:general substrate transporter [Dioszegia hungarica]KAI9638810.1 general substrate transporter [Dioszegia hungarica]